MFKSTPNTAMSQRLNKVSAASVSATVPNNESICDYQARTIGQLERQYAAGEISEFEYRQRYGEYAAAIREMGR